MHTIIRMSNKVTALYETWMQIPLSQELAMSSCNVFTILATKAVYRWN